MEKFRYDTACKSVMLTLDVEANVLEKVEIITTYNNSREPSRQITIKGIYKEDSCRVSVMHDPKEEEITYDCEEFGLTQAFGCVLSVITEHTQHPISLKADEIKNCGVTTRYSITFE